MTSNAMKLAAGLAVALVASVHAAQAAAPVPVPDYAIERSLGAACPNDAQGAQRLVGQILTGPCQGPMPAALRAVLLAIPEQEIHLPASWRAQRMEADVDFRAIPSPAGATEWIAQMDDIWLRSLPGRRPDEHFYLVEGPFHCVDGTDLATIPGEPIDMPAGKCDRAQVERRVYRLDAKGVLRNVTRSALPAEPEVTREQMRRYGAQEPFMQEDLWRLQHPTPVSRWFIRFIGAPAPDDPAAFYGGYFLHVRFDVWNGRRFVPQKTVNAAQWPCLARPTDQPQCDERGIMKSDPFVVPAPASADSGAATLTHAGARAP